MCDTANNYNTNEYYMARAIELAKSAMGHTSPNPMVGCVVVKNGRIISEACHERYGEYHAERNALLRCKEDTTGATLYVTLEPCCHYGKTPPCTEIIIEKKIAKVYIGSMDSNPLVKGKSVNILKDAGIEVVTGILEKECEEMNEIFYHYITTKRPFVAMKYACTLDGKICSVTGDSKWITGESAREHVHFLRKKYSSILVGVGTVIADNPMLNCRIEDGVNPVRIICDSNLRIPMECDIVKTAGSIPTIIAHCCTDEEKIKRLNDCNITTIRTGSDDGHVNLNELMNELGKMKIDSVLVEGGAQIHGSFIRNKLVNRVYAYIAPKIIAGKAKSPVEGEGIEKMADAVKLSDIKTTRFGDDILIEGRCNMCLPE